MKHSEDYLKAAELVDRKYRQGREYWSCLAVKSEEASNTYSKLFSPCETLGCYDEWGLEFGDSYKERAECRVLALLFMSAIAASEGN